MESPIKIEKRTNKVIIDHTNIPLGVCKEVEIPVWLGLKTKKFIVCNENGKIAITPVE